MRIFVASASDLLTDHLPHGEGLIAWQVLRRLSERGHEVVACTRRVEIAGPVPFEVAELERGRLPSVEGLHYARAVDRELGRRGTSSFDVALWMFPQGREHIVWRAPVALPMVVGPIACGWPGRGRSRRLGDLVRFVASPITGARYRSVLRQARSVLVATPMARAELPGDVASGAPVTPFGVDVDAFPFEPACDAPVIAFVGSLETKKGVRDLLEAHPAVIDRVPDAQLVFVGGGPDHGWLTRRTAELEIQPNVRFLGRLPHEAVKDVVRAAAVCCAPSHGEPFGMVVLEAMASGRAVVTTDAGGPALLVQHEVGGLVVPVGDRTALGDALATLLADPARCRAMGAHNRLKVGREHTWEQCVDKIEQALMDAS